MLALGTLVAPGLLRLVLLAGLVLLRLTFHAQIITTGRTSSGFLYLPLTSSNATR